MATVITEECINCGACEPECPNTAIYQGGVEYDLDGQTVPALSDSIFYIVPEKCTECVGFYDHEACAAVCPVDCCIPDPNRPESEEALLERARQLHPEQTFGPDFPSRFKKEGAEGAAEGDGGGNGAAAAPEAAPAPAAPAPTAAKPAAAVAPKTVAPTGRVEKPTAPPPRAAEVPKPKRFGGELPEDFEILLEQVRMASRGRTGWLVRLVVALLQPVIGALPHGTKQAIEVAVGDRRYFSNAGATALNILHNMILYPAILIVLAWLALEAEVFSAQMRWWIFLGMVVATVESMWRLREGVFGAQPVERLRFGPAFYGLPLAAFIAPFASRMTKGREQVRTAGFDGFYGGNFDEKTERERRYGDVYRFEDLGAAYLLRLEFPRVIPPTGLKEELGLPDTMPDYDFDLSLSNGCFVVHGKVIDPRVRKLTSVAPAFPSEFTTQIELDSAVRGFRHRYHDKLLEVVLPKA